MPKFFRGIGAEVVWMRGVLRLMQLAPAFHLELDKVHRKMTKLTLRGTRTTPLSFRHYLDRLSDTAAL